MKNISHEWNISVKQIHMEEYLKKYIRNILILKCIEYSVLNQGPHVKVIVQYLTF